MKAEKFLIDQHFLLSDQGIEECIELLDQLSYEEFKDQRNKKAILLRVEEALLGFRQKFGPEKSFGLFVNKAFDIYNLKIEVEGEYHDPFRDRYASPELRLFDQSLSRYGAGFEYRYQEGKNRISTSFNKKTKLPDLMILLLTVLVGVAIGFFSTLLPQKLQTYPYSIAQTVQSIILGLMSFATLPLVFLSIIEGVTACGSLSNLGKRGGGTIRTYLFTNFLFMMLAFAAACVVFPLKMQSGQNTANAFDMILSALAGLFPHNIVAPFAEANMPQVVLIGMMIGCTILITRGKKDHSLLPIGRLCGIFSTMLQWFSKLIPVALACMITVNIIDGSFVKILQVWPMLVTILALFAVVFTAMLLYTSVSVKTGPLNVLRAVAKPFFIGLQTASAATTIEYMKASLSKLRVDEDYSAVALPIGLSFFSPADMMSNLLVLLFFAHLSGTEISAGWIVSVLLLDYVFAIASPPVAGATVAAMTILFPTFGIETQWHSLGFLYLMLIDYVVTAFRVGLLQMLCVCKAKSLDLRNGKKLQ